MRLYFCVMSLCLFLLPGAAQAQDWFEGIYVSLRSGPLIAHPAKGRIDLDRPNVPLRQQPGFAIGGALGIWLRFFDESRLRSEIEFSYQRFALEIKNRPFGLRRDEGRGNADSFNFLWNNYFNFYALRSRHQPWLGLGVGGSRQKRNFYYLRQRNEAATTDLALAVMIGYDFRLTDQLGIGAHYRYMHIFDTASDSKQSQLMFGLIYGF